MDRSLRPAVLCLVLAGILAGRTVNAQDPAFHCSEGSDTNASVVVPAFASISLNDRPAREEVQIAVYTSDGVCAGTGTWNGEAMAFPIWEDDPGRPLKDGMRPGERIRFRLWDPESEQAYEARVELSGEENPDGSTARYEADAIFVVQSLSARGSTDDPTLQGYELRLFENYPNPFASTTTIPFEVPEAAPVILEVFNTVGARVATLIDGIVLIGQQEYVWSPEHLSAGLYFIRLKAGEAVQTRSLIHIE